MRILIVEDNEVNRTFLLEVLGAYGKCVGVETGEQGLGLFREHLDAGHPFDVVFMDLMLPGMDGLQAIETMRSLERKRAIPVPRRTKIVVASARDDEAGVQRAFFRGQAVSYLTKPLKLKSLRTEMDKLTV